MILFRRSPVEGGYEGIYNLCVGVGIKPGPSSIGLFRCEVFTSKDLNIVLYLGLYLPFIRDADLRCIGSERGWVL
jgi:hypothetical protein